LTQEQQDDLKQRHDKHRLRHDRRNKLYHSKSQREYRLHKKNAKDERNKLLASLKQSKSSTDTPTSRSSASSNKQASKRQRTTPSSTKSSCATQLAPVRELQNDFEDSDDAKVEVTPKSSSNANQDDDDVEMKES
jgi:hypothetical protein